MSEQVGLPSVPAMQDDIKDVAAAIERLHANTENARKGGHLRQAQDALDDATEALDAYQNASEEGDGDE